MAPSMRRASAKRRTHRKTLVRAAIFVVLLGVGMLYSIAPRPSFGEEPAGTLGVRRLQGNMTQPVVRVDKCIATLDNSFDDKPVLAMIVYILLMLWVFLGIAGVSTACHPIALPAPLPWRTGLSSRIPACMLASVVCDDYFCVSLEVICEQLQLSEAVAGATFMAAGSSAPELATSLVATFSTRDATGLGTILGSAVFNLVAIICLSGIFGAGPTYKLTNGNPSEENVKKLHFTEKMEEINKTRSKKLPAGLYLDWRPLGRDALFYIFALALCVVFALTGVGDGWEDSQFNNKPGFVWWEGLILCLCYGIYIHSMIIDEHLMNWLKVKIGMSTHIELYLDELQKLEDGGDDEDTLDEGEPSNAGAHRTTHWHGGTGVALGRTPAGNSPRPGRKGGATETETHGLLDRPDIEAPGQATGDGVEEEVVSIDSVTLQSAVIKTNTHLEQQILALKAKVEALEQQNKKPYKWEYKPMEEEEEETLVDKFIGIAGKPWEMAFQITIPPCDRDAFQTWDDTPIAFQDIDPEGQEIILNQREKGMQDAPADTDAFYKGKYKKTRVRTDS